MTNSVTSITSFQQEEHFLTSRDDSFLTTEDSIVGLEIACGCHDDPSETEAADASASFSNSNSQVSEPTSKKKKRSSLRGMSLMNGIRKSFGSKGSLLTLSSEKQETSSKSSRRNAQFSSSRSSKRKGGSSSTFATATSVEELMSMLSTMDPQEASRIVRKHVSDGNLACLR